MTPPVTFPTITTRRDVENAVIESLKSRMPQYCTEMGIPVPRRYVPVADDDRWPEDQLPTLVVVCGGLVEEPTKDGAGNYTAIWGVGILAVCSASTEDRSRELSGLYAGLVRATIAQQPSLGGFAQGVYWTDEGYDVFSTKNRRSIAYAEVMFSVVVANVLSTRELPIVIDDPEAPTPTPSGYTVQSTEVIVNSVEEVNP